MHELRIERRVEKDIDDLPRDVAERVIRVGDYCVLYEIHDNQRLVRVMRVKHRRDAYR